MGWIEGVDRAKGCGWGGRGGFKMFGSDESSVGNHRRFGSLSVISTLREMVIHAVREGRF